MRWRKHRQCPLLETVANCSRLRTSVLWVAVRCTPPLHSPLKIKHGNNSIHLSDPRCIEEMKSDSAEQSYNISAEFSLPPAAQPHSSSRILSLNSVWNCCLDTVSQRFLWPIGNIAKSVPFLNLNDSDIFDKVTALESGAVNLTQRRLKAFTRGEAER